LPSGKRKNRIFRRKNGNFSGLNKVLAVAGLKDFCGFFELVLGKNCCFLELI